MEGGRADPQAFFLAVIHQGTPGGSDLQGAIRAIRPIASLSSPPPPAVAVLQDRRSCAAGPRCLFLPDLASNQSPSLTNKKINPPQRVYSSSHPAIPGVPTSSLGSSQISQPVVHLLLLLHSFSGTSGVAVMCRAPTVGVGGAEVTKARSTAPAPWRRQMFYPGKNCPPYKRPDSVLCSFCFL